MTFAYTSDGYMETITDPLGSTVRFAYDAAGRLTTQTLADSRIVRYSYDAAGNRVAIIPSGRSAHTFTYNPVGLVSAYSPPNVGADANDTGYAFDTDRRLTRISRPDGQTVEFSFDAGGRSSTVVLPRGQVQRSYDPNTGNLASITAPGGIVVAFSHEATLLTGESWSGPVAGRVSRTYDNSFRMSSQSLAGGASVSYRYDNDGWVTQAGPLLLS
ncbi:MAG: hypothetical protein DMD98_19810, partial [Candidatus Rokuibacteriota bacterium]